MVAVSLLMAGCGGGNSAPPPLNVSLTAGDTSATVSWNQDSGVEYWIWVAQGTDVSPQNCSSKVQCRTFIAVNTPFIVTGLTNGTTYSVSINGRTGGGPGGPGTVPIAFVPRLAGSIWNVGTPLGTSNLLGIAFTPSTSVGGGTTLAAVGAGGTIFSSTNLAAWSPETSGVTANLNGALFTSSQFLATGDLGTMLTSPDAITWTARTTKTTNNLYALATNSTGNVVAVGAKGTIVVSNNNTDWTVANSGTTSDLFAVAFGNGRYIAVGANGTMLTSPGGNTWTAIAPTTGADLRGVTFGSILATATTPATSRFVAVGSAGALVTSPDGVTWTAQAPIATNNLTGVVHGTQFVAVGSGGGIFTSLDGLAWLPAESGTTANLNAVTFTVLTAVSIGVGYAAVGDGGVNLIAF